MLLNCDLGECVGDQEAGTDEAIMPHIHQANIACGGHAGSPAVMRSTLLLARQHNVAAGAHPSYPDREGFGRRSMALSKGEIVAVMHEQISSLEDIARTLGMSLAHIKPHGALYNDMMRDTKVRRAVLDAVSGYHCQLPLLMLATADAARHRREADAVGVQVLFEAFADRRYTDEGTLLSRDQPGAVLHIDEMLEQVRQLCAERSVTTDRGNRLTLQADTLCVHGDNPVAVAAVGDIRAMVDAG